MKFSEDIDIVVLRNGNETDNQLKKKIRAISKIVEGNMPEVNIEGLTNKMGNIRKTAHQYSKLFDGDFGQVREHVILETTWLGNFEPYSNWQLSSYLADMMSKKGQNEMVGEYNMQPFTVQVLGKDRTLCEKIMSLVRFSRQRDPYIDLANKIRHIYDIHLMLRNNELKAFIKSEAFEKMLIKVGEDDVIGYKNDHEWLVEHL